MKRRNGECAKLRRPIKRNKITDGIYGSAVLYLKFFVLWALVLLADFLLEFRFEFLWPFWLLLRSVYDSYKYQGLAFSVFFVSIALTSDMICYFFIPVQWLFFAASTYVWVQYVWHTEKGICLPTVFLWLLFAYMEAAVRLRDLRHMPFHLDLCRPFAAHCIGYPVVTLGFGFKSYVSYRIRQKRQRDVRKENSFYMNLLAQALPIETEPQTTTAPSNSDKVKQTESNGVGQKGSSHRKSLDKGDHSAQNGTLHHNEQEFKEKPRAVLEVEEEGVEKEKSSSSSSTSSSTATGTGGHGRKGGGGRESKRDPTSNNYHNKRNQRYSINKEPPINTNTINQQTVSNEYCLRLESEVRRLKGEVQSSRQSEQEARAQLATALNNEKRSKIEISSLQHQNEDLINKVQSLTAGRQQDKGMVGVLERRLGEERRLKASLEAQLSAERKARLALQQQHIPNNRGECTETCKGRRRELENEIKQLRREVKLKEERCANTDRELQSLAQYKESQGEMEMLVQAVSLLKEKNSHLENSLSAETRIKLDLFSALGEAKRQLEIRECLVRGQERETEELKKKLAQVLAVMPAECLQKGGVPKLPLSPLDPNASVYTPKQGHLTTEA